MAATDPQVAEATFILDPFFFSQLDSTKNKAIKPMDRYYRAAKFVSVDLFEMQYIIIPINKQ